MTSFTDRLVQSQNELLVLEFAADECFTRFHDWKRSDLIAHARAAIDASRPVPPVEDTSSEGSPRLRRSAEATTRLLSPMGALQSRDVRKLDPGFENLLGGSEAALLVRDGAIVVSAARVRGLILNDRCFIVVPNGADSILNVLQTRLNKVFTGPVEPKLVLPPVAPSLPEGQPDAASKAGAESNADGAIAPPTDGATAPPTDGATTPPTPGDSAADADAGSVAAPWEFRALEAILLTVTNELTATARAVAEAMRSALEGMRVRPASKTTQRALFEQLQRLRSVQQSARSVSKTIAHVLESDEDMASMYLSTHLAFKAGWALQVRVPRPLHSRARARTHGAASSARRYGSRHTRILTLCRMPSLLPAARRS